MCANLHCFKCSGTKVGLLCKINWKKSKCRAQGPDINGSKYLSPVFLFLYISFISQVHLGFPGMLNLFHSWYTFMLIFRVNLPICCWFPWCPWTIHFASQYHICAMLTHPAIYYTFAYLSTFSCQGWNSTLLQKQGWLPVSSNDRF